jgi:hypothetical protein
MFKVTPNHRGDSPSFHRGGEPLMQGLGSAQPPLDRLISGIPKTVTNHPYAHYLSQELRKEEDKG